MASFIAISEIEIKPPVWIFINPGQEGGSGDYSGKETGIHPGYQSSSIHTFTLVEINELF